MKNNPTELHFFCRERTFHKGNSNVCVAKMCNKNIIINLDVRSDPGEILVRFVCIESSRHEESTYLYLVGVVVHALNINQHLSIVCLVLGDPTNSSGFEV